MAPCTYQPPEIHYVIVSFFYYLPTLFYLLAIIPAWFAPIDAAKQAEIIEQTALRHEGLESYDPLTGAVLPPYPTEEEREEMNALLHFDEDELEYFELHGFMSFVWVVVRRLVSGAWSR